MQRAKVHIPGIAEYRNVGVVVDRDDTYWHIEDDEGRTFFAQVAWSSVSDVKIGDRVEFEPIVLSWAATRLTNRAWAIVRRVEPRS